MSSLSDLIFLADRLIDHTDLLHLECSCLCPPTCFNKNLVVFTLSEDLPFNRNFCLSPMSSLLGSLYHLNVSIGYLFEVKKNTVSHSLVLSFPEYAHSIIETVFSLIKISYPNASMHCINSLSLFESPINGISSLSFLPTSTHKNESTLPKLFTFLQGQCYSIFFLAVPLDQCDYLKQRKQFLLLHERLFSFRETTDSRTNSTSNTDSRTCTQTDSQTDTNAQTTNDSSTQNRSKNQSASTSLNFSPKVSEKATITQNNSSNSTDNQSISTSNSDSTTCTDQSVRSSTHSDSDTCSKSSSHTFSTKTFSREVDLHLQKIDALLKLFEINMTLPLFDFAAYFISHSIGVALTANSTYTSLIQPTMPLSTNFYTNNWYDQPNCLEHIQCYLETLRHPFFFPASASHPLSPTLTLNNYELNQLVFACTCPNT